MEPPPSFYKGEIKHVLFSITYGLLKELFRNYPLIGGVGGASRRKSYQPWLIALYDGRIRC